MFWVRLSISPRGTTLGNVETPGARRTPLRGGLKRKRAAFDEYALDEVAYESNARSNGDVEIVEDDPEGKFVKLRNKSDKV